MPVSDKERIKIGQGWVSHARSPNGVKNSFRYQIFNLLIPVHQSSELAYLQTRKALSLKAEDYLEGNTGTLQENIEKFLNEKLNYQCEEVWLQTLPRLLGFAFNPISFWYCYKKGVLDSILCEVNNTFGERHFYFIQDFKDDSSAAYKAEKNLYVSPFFPVEGHYIFKFKLDAQTVDIVIQYYQKNSLELSTRICLNHQNLRNISSFSLFKNYGWMTLLVVLRIHFQALRLWLKKAVYHSRPLPPLHSITRAERI